jgi:hypothetical protein
MKKEKARQWGEPIPNAVVLADNRESNVAPIDLQALRLTRRFAVSMPVALLLADLAYRSEVAR